MNNWQLSASSRPASRRRPPYAWRFAPAFCVLVLMLSCGPSQPQLTGPAAAYANAKQTLARGMNDSFEKALETLGTLSNADPPNDYTNKARVLSAAILCGEMDGHKMLSDAYAKGAAVTKETALKRQYTSLHSDTQERAAHLALDLGEVVLQLTKGGALPSGLTLDVGYPNPEPGTEIPALIQVKQGLKIGQDEVDEAALEAPRIGFVNALASMVQGDRAKAKSELTAGPVPLASAPLALYLGNEVMGGASLYDPKHLNDPEHFKPLLGVVDDAAQAAEAALKQNPNADESKSLKKLQEEIKAGLKAARM